jgi:hypothetical protein
MRKKELGDAEKRKAKDTTGKLTRKELGVGK